jgi:hypothetical protein
VLLSSALRREHKGATKKAGVSGSTEARACFTGLSPRGVDNRQFWKQLKIVGVESVDARDAVNAEEPSYQRHNQNIRVNNSGFNGHRRKGRDDAMSLWLRDPTPAIRGQGGERGLQPQ